MAQDIAKRNSAGVPHRHWIISAHVERFSDTPEEGDSGKMRKPVPLGYNRSSSILVLGFGGIGDAQRAYLTKVEKSKLGG
ncbi:hypothetical protein [Paraburkholderia humisilvae]|uniref:Uncharacterized protein n=1 Tax=Paraburkholderia humisilvae TaxID=627669 RepID=A0A6J5F3J8_9BURK|nr:hypothetical protein [Paraburkholderia humisilvae]CAB3772142.1 hypothetical protein LMG29542_06802 [Paraburkholderia humisilvae]